MRVTLPTGYKVDTRVTTHLTDGIRTPVDGVCGTYLGTYRVHSRYYLVY